MYYFLFWLLANSFYPLYVFLFPLSSSSQYLMSFLPELLIFFYIYHVLQSGNNTLISIWIDAMYSSINDYIYTDLHSPQKHTHTHTYGYLKTFFHLKIFYCFVLSKKLRLVVGCFLILEDFGFIFQRVNSLYSYSYLSCIPLWLWGL